MKVFIEDNDNLADFIWVSKGNSVGGKKYCYSF